MASKKTTMEEMKNVAFDKVGEVEISTRWLGASAPAWAEYETMVFGGTMNGETRKYSTRQEATAGHVALVAEVENASATAQADTKESAEMSSSDYISQVFEGDTVMVIENGFIIVAKGAVVRMSPSRFTVRTENAVADIPALIQFSRKTGKQVGGGLYMVEYDSAIYEDALAEMVDVEQQQESEPAQVDEEMDEESKRKRMWAELDALTEMMIRDSIIQDHLVAEEVKNARAVTKTCAKCGAMSVVEAFRQVGNTVDGYARLCLDCEDENERQSRLNAQVATKVEKLAESLKHNKSSVVTPRGELGYSNIPYRDLGEKSNFCFALDRRKSLAGGGFGMYATSGYLDEDLYQRYMFHRCSEGASDITGNKDGFCTAFAMVATSGLWGRKVYGVRNKSGLKVDWWYRHQVLEALDSLIYDTRPSRFFEGETVRTPRQSQAVRDGYYHWFPVALENTTYSDAIARHNVSSNGAIKRGHLVYSIANTRHYSNTTMRDKRVLYLGNKAH